MASDQLQAVSAAVSKAVQDFIQAVSADIVDRRIAVRQAVNKAVIVKKNGKSFEACATDISSAGMKISPIEDLSLDDTVNVDIGFDRVDATVKWINGNGCGLEFARSLREQQIADPRWKEEIPGSKAA